ncbi:voltage-gated hydrogen channel 1-like [Actinia tenebrosa]|uniref:Voltage-gated hydrogen channel 1 n=1 Tax=Actinia tenebrosa TaxID=6105 RepID=A0A6P8IDD2_ACTTE|nr:voltage-gated hydrogen channel 1-like [Actinia tenebrosa]
MDPDDQQLVGRLSFDELSTDTAEMEVGGAGDSNLEVVPSTPWWKDNRAKLRELLHSQKAQYTVVGLVVLDCIIVIAELIVDLQILKVHHDNPAPHILHYISIAILSIFLIELILKMYAMGLDFLRHKMEVFDGIVVVVSFALDIAFSGSESAAEGASLLVILRLWRVTRIVNGIVMSVKIQAEKKIEQLTAENDELKEEIIKIKTRNAELEKEISALKGQ